MPGNKRNNWTRCLIAGIVLLMNHSIEAIDHVARVSPVDEIIVMEPGIDNEGKPKAIIQKGEHGDTVDIPPTVIVHKYYYTGDRNFQGPYFPGGPSIVVVSDPVTHERLYLEVQMLPGAPRVTYRRNSIDYDFGKKGIRIQFASKWDFIHKCKPRVSYHHGKSQMKKIAESLQKHSDKQSSWLERTGIPQATVTVVSGTTTMAGKTADGIHFVGKTISTPVVKIVNSTPLNALFTPSPEAEAIRLRDQNVRNAEFQQRNRDLYIPSNR
tara:strand:- start:2136 stop:2939 length:804 start_codon:yes stop_codon:yes gene_type:complete